MTQDTFDVEIPATLSGGAAVMHDVRLTMRSVILVSPLIGRESEAYQILTSRPNGKMVDAWAAIEAADPGLACCQAADLTNPTSTADTRIDPILTRASAVKTEDIWMVGMTARTPSAGLWASDHFGVVAQLLVR